MNFKEYEETLVKSIRNLANIIIKTNLSLPISARARAGAEISDHLEDKFVELVEKNSSPFLFDAVPAPKSKTKNPFDVECYFKYKGRTEKVWIDFKAFKLTQLNSNPDIGSPSKVIKFIKEGNFYIVFVLVYYKESQRGLEFTKKDGEFCKVYLLKDVNSTFRRNPKNQLQVNISAEPEYRTRKQFIELLIKKIKESHERQINISRKALENTDKLKEELINKNREAEETINNY